MIKSPGFWLFPDMFDGSDCDRLLASIMLRSATKSRAGLRNLMSNSAVREFAHHPRLLDLSGSILESAAIPFKATFFEKTSKANWLVAFHQDSALPVETAPDAEGWGQSSVKNGVLFSHAPTPVLQQILALRIHLDDSTRLNGPLRVIPNSHNERVTDDAAFEKIVSDGEKVDCLIGKGGVIAMSPLIFHASSKIVNEAARRVLHIEYSRSLNVGPGIRLAMA